MDLTYHELFLPTYKTRVAYLGDLSGSRTRVTYLGNLGGRPGLAVRRPLVLQSVVLTLSDLPVWGKVIQKRGTPTQGVVVLRVPV